MNFKIDIDITPEEFRRLMGLPDMQSFYEESLNEIRERMRAGAEGYDPVEFMRPFVGQATASMDMFQRMMTGLMGMGMGLTPKKNRDPEG